MTNIEMSQTWVPPACTLSTAEQPLRAAEFDELFATAVRAVERPAADRLVLVLDAGSEGSARDLAARENGCCSFFDFAFSAADGGELRLSVGVPAGYLDVLEALASRAAAAAGTASK